MKIENLIEKLKHLFDKEVAIENFTLEETIYVLQGLIAPVCQTISEDSNSQEALDNNESWVATLLRDAIYPFFEKKRKQLITEGSYRVPSYSKEVISDQITGILAHNNVTPDDGLDLVSELAGMVTLLRAETITTLNELETVEKSIIAALKEKVNHAGDVIRLKHGFIRKN